MCTCACGPANSSGGCLQSDPLGLNAAPAEGGDANLAANQRKRRGSEEQGPGYVNLKRPKVSSPTGSARVSCPVTRRASQLG